MKIQCNVCESGEATVLCCADEAALCWSCDEKVHAATKLASKHQRVPLSNSSSQMPKCDICQETDGYFFCLEDRALLCRKCDIAIHTVNALVSSHQRFLLTGVKIGLETAPPSPVKLSVPCEEISEVPETFCVPNSVPMSIPAAGSDNFSSPHKLPFGGGSSADQWQFDEFFGLTDLNQNYNYIENGSSKADGNKMGDSNCSSILRALEVELDSDECFQVPDSSSWAVPDISSPPTTASGLCLPKHYDHDRTSQMDSVAFVPDVCYSPMTDFNQPQQNLKRRRYF